jgi:hypothetical protein
VSFFETPPPPPEPVWVEPPSWSGPRANVLPVAFLLNLPLARNDRVAVLAQSGRAYSNGFTFDVSVRTREPRHARAESPFTMHLEGDTIPDELLRIGYEGSDGQKGQSSAPAVAIGMTLAQSCG